MSLSRQTEPVTGEDPSHHCLFPCTGLISGKKKKLDYIVREKGKCFPKMCKQGKNCCTRQTGSSTSAVRRNLHLVLHTGVMIHSTESSNHLITTHKHHILTRTKIDDMV